MLFEKFFYFLRKKETQVVLILNLSICHLNLMTLGQTLSDFFVLFLYYFYIIFVTRGPILFSQIMLKYMHKNKDDYVGVDNEERYAQEGPVYGAEYRGRQLPDRFIAFVGIDLGTA